MERAPFGKTRRRGLVGAVQGWVRCENSLRFLRSVTSNSHESYLGAAWVSPDRTCENRGYAKGGCREEQRRPSRQQGTPKCRNRIRDRSSRPRPSVAFCVWSLEVRCDDD